MFVFAEVRKGRRKKRISLATILAGIGENWNVHSSTQAPQQLYWLMDMQYNQQGSEKVQDMSFFC